MCPSLYSMASSSHSWFPLNCGQLLWHCVHLSDSTMPRLLVSTSQPFSERTPSRIKMLQQFHDVFPPLNIKRELESPCKCALSALCLSPYKIVRQQPCVEHPDTASMSVLVVESPPSSEVSCLVTLAHPFLFHEGQEYSPKHSGWTHWVEIKDDLYCALYIVVPVAGLSFIVLRWFKAEDIDAGVLLKWLSVAGAPKPWKQSSLRKLASSSLFRH